MTRPKLMRSTNEHVLLCNIPALMRSTNEPRTTSLIPYAMTSDQFVAPEFVLPESKAELDFSWWEQDEDDWDVYDPYANLSDEEYADYLYDRSLQL